MPKGLRGQKRPADVIGNAVRVMKIATGEITETTAEDGKNKAAVELGRKGGQARADRLSAKERKGNRETSRHGPMETHEIAPVDPLQQQPS